jgi:hypothetical protein
MITMRWWAAICLCTAATSSVSPPRVARGKANCSTTARYALALRGGVSKLGRDSHGAGTAYFNEGRAVNITIIANALRRHLFGPNGGRSRFDVFIHSWSYDLAPLMNDLYKPVDAVFENQSSPKIRSQILARLPQGDRSRPKGYSPFSGVASFLSMQKVLALVREREDLCGRYARIILYRPDVLIWGGDMKLETYDQGRVTANQHDSIGTGDFHWVFSSETARRFRPYDSLSLNSELFFGYVRDYIQREVTPDVPPAVDAVKPCGRCIQGGPCQEVYRKICKCKRRAITYLGYDEAEARTMGCRPKDKSRKTALRDVT